MTSQRFYGIYRGTVFDNRDPYGSNRLKVIVPQILGSNPTEWIWGMDTPSTKTAPPEIGQGVLVMFEGGDPVYPIWVGTFGQAVVTEKKPYLSPLSNSVSLAGITDLVVTHSSLDGEVGIDLTSSVVALAHGVKSGSGVTGPTGPTGPTGAAGRFTTSDTAPVSPTAGDAWFDSSRGFTYVYYSDGDSSQWVQIGNANTGATGPTGPTGAVDLSTIFSPFLLMGS
jgi:Type VI secretion system/phage-baseplate injector OB domain